MLELSFQFAQLILARLTFISCDNQPWYIATYQFGDPFSPRFIVGLDSLSDDVAEERDDHTHRCLGVRFVDIRDLFVS